MYTIGIDPGSKTYDFFGLNEGRPVLEETIDTESLVGNPSLVVTAVKKTGKPDAIIAPSGYGLPITHIRDVGTREIFLMSLVRRDDEDLRIPELQVSYERIIRELNDEGIEGYILPGVIHLPSVPRYRKRNKIDMGTPDKLCSAALAIHNQAKTLKSSYDETSLILIELGFAYNTVLAVENGKIVDGIGGTLGGPGLLSSGGWDGEVAYLLNPLRKRHLFQGGVNPTSSDQGNWANLEPARPPSIQGDGWKAFFEGIEKTVTSLMVSVPRPRQIILSGRLSKQASIAQMVGAQLSRFCRVDVLEGFTRRVKDAAQGAALLANGIIGGEYADLVDNMELQKASGTALDYIQLDGVSAIRAEHGI